MKKAGSQLDVRSLRWQWWQRTLVECCACPVCWCFEDRNLGSERREDGEPEMELHFTIPIRKCRPLFVRHRFFFRYFQKAHFSKGGHQTCSPPFLGGCRWSMISPIAMISPSIRPRKLAWSSSAPLVGTPGPTTDPQLAACIGILDLTEDRRLIWMKT